LHNKAIHSLDGAAETLVLLRIVVLKSNLELDGLEEVAFFLLRLGQQFVDALVEDVFRYLRPEIIEKRGLILISMTFERCPRLLEISSTMQALNQRYEATSFTFATFSMAFRVV
jgi:hypothetical protein